MKSDRLYVEHILECIERIQRYCEGGGPSFLEQNMIQDAVLRNLQVLAESAKRVSGELKAAHPEIDWHGIVGFRNVLVHEYLGIDLQRVYGWLLYGLLWVLDKWLAPVLYLLLSFGLVVGLLSLERPGGPVNLWRAMVGLVLVGYGLWTTWIQSEPPEKNQRLQSEISRLKWEASITAPLHAASFIDLPFSNAVLRFSHSLTASWMATSPRCRTSAVEFRLPGNGSFSLSRRSTAS